MTQNSHDAGRSSQNRPCPVCTNNHGCKFIEKNAVICLRNDESSTPDGWRFVKLADAGMGAIFAPNDAESESEYRRVVSEAKKQGRRTQWQKTWDGAGADCGIGATYFASRGLSAKMPPAFRLHPSLDYYSEGKKIGASPAIVAPILDLYRKQIGSHVTYIKSDGSGKADFPTPRKTHGKIKGGHVELCDPGDTIDALLRHLAITEGIETGLAVRESTGMVVWAALSAPGMQSIEVSERKITYYFADNDANRVGQGAAAAVAIRDAGAGRTTYVVIPPVQDTDWLDVFQIHGREVVRAAMQDAEPSEAPADGRSKTSPENGKKGGRPSVDWGVLSASFCSTLKDTSGRATIRYHRGDWYAYRNGVYLRVSYDHVGGLAMEWLQANYSEKANIGSRDSILANLKTLGMCMVSEYLPIPLWISKQLSATDWHVMGNHQAVNPRNLARFLNGEDLPESELRRDATPDLFSTFAVPYAFDERAECPKWKSYLADVQPNALDRDVIQMLFGLSLVPETRFNVAFFLFGPAGTGKSVLVHILQAMVGRENFCCLPLANFGARFSIGQLTTNKLNIVGDCPTEGDRGDLKHVEGLFKDVCDGGSIAVEYKNRDPYTAPAIARCVFAANSLPRFSDKSEAMWDRLRIVPFNVRIRGTEKADSRLRHQIAESELPGVFMWAVEGLARLQKLHVFPEHSEGRVAKQLHQQVCDPERAFLEVSCESGKSDQWVLATELHTLYSSWCEENSHKSKSIADFSKSVLRVFGGATSPRIRMDDGSRRRVFTHITYSSTATTMCQSVDRLDGRKIDPT